MPMAVARFVAQLAVVAAASSAQRGHYTLVARTTLDAADGASMRPAQLDYPAPAVTNCSGPDVAMLVIVMSCMSHAHLWDDIRAFGRTMGASQGVLILVGRPLDTQYELNMENSTLFVNSSDLYDALSEKLARAFTTVVVAPELAGVTHIMKIDDTDITDSLHITKDQDPNDTSATKTSKNSTSPFPQQVSVTAIENQLRGVGACTLQDRKSVV